MDHSKKPCFIMICTGVIFFTLWNMNSPRLFCPCTATLFTVVTVTQLFPLQTACNNRTTYSAQSSHCLQAKNTDPHADARSVFLRLVVVCVLS